MKRFVLVIGLLVIFAVALAVFQSQAPETPNTSAQKQRIISLAPNLTEIVFALGHGHELVGVTTYCDRPNEAKSVEKIGDFLNPNFEKMLALKPTLVFLEAWTSSKHKKRLNDLQLNAVETLSPKSLSEVYEVIALVGQSLGETERANEIMAEMKNRMLRVQTEAKSMNWQPKVYIEIDPPSWTVGKHSFITQAIELLGGENIFSDVDKRALQASEETIIARNPDIIISFFSDRASIQKRAGWKNVSAVQKGYIIDNLDRALLSRGNQHLASGIEVLLNRFKELKS